MTEDVCPIENGYFPASHVGFQGGCNSNPFPQDGKKKSPTVEPSWDQECPSTRHNYARRKPTNSLPQGATRHGDLVKGRPQKFYIICSWFLLVVKGQARVYP